MAGLRKNEKERLLDLGPCRISNERFSYLNERKYQAELTQLEISDYISYQFYQSFGYNLNLLSPKTFNEKLNWLKVFYHNPVMHICADKARAKEFIMNKSPDMAEHCVEAYKIIHSPEELVFDDLPESFVMKSNFGSGAQLFVNKSHASWDAVRQRAATWLDPRRNHYYLALEYSYKDIPPAIVCERIISYEYKIEFFCFHGEPFCYWVILGDKTKDVCANYYTMSGDTLDVRHGYGNFARRIGQPPYFPELVAMARTLSADFPHVRVDFYAAKDTWYFSELTFYIWAGLKPFSSFEFDLMLGRRIQLMEYT